MLRGPVGAVGYDGDIDAVAPQYILPFLVAVDNAKIICVMSIYGHIFFYIVTVCKWFHALCCGYINHHIT